MGEDTCVTIGKIVGTHGIRGNLKVLSFADSADVFAPGNALAFNRKGKPTVNLCVSACRTHKNIVILTIEGIDSMEAAKALVGCKVCIQKSALPPTPQGDFYWYQIIGMKVFTSQNVLLGNVEAIFPTGSNDVYVVRNGKKEVLVPAIDSVVVDIDLHSKTMRVDLPEGLED